MVLDLTRVLRLWLALVAEQLLVFPIAVILYRFAGMEQFFLFTFCHLAVDGMAMLARALLPKRARPWILILGMLAGVGLCMAFSENLFFRIAIPVALAAILWHGVHLTELGNPGNFFTSYLLLGFLLYPLTGWIFSRSSRFADLLVPLGITGTAGILLALIIINRQQIRDAGTILERKLHLPAALMRKNSLYLALFTVIVLAGASWRFFSNLAMALFTFLGKSIGAIIAFLSGLYQSGEEMAEEPVASEAAPDMMPPAEPTPRWLEILQDIMMILLGIVCVAFILWGLYRLGRRLIPFLKKAFTGLWAWLQRVFVGDMHHASSDLGFVDEVESLLNKNETTLSAARRWLLERMAREPGYATMKTDAERVRWLYRNLVRKEMRRGFVMEPGDTPTEILQAISMREGRRIRLDPATAAMLYDWVRYAEQEPEPDAVRQMKRACD